MQKHMLKLIHQSHMGMVKSKQPAKDFQDKISRQPLKPKERPELPFEEVVSDLFEFNSKLYILLVDYFSKFCWDLLLVNNSWAYMWIQSLTTCLLFPGDKGELLELKDRSHVLFPEFDQLPSGRHYRAYKCETNCLKLSFIPTSITLLNKETCGFGHVSQ